MQKLQLQTDRLVLRDFKATDWKEVHEYATDPDVVKFMEWGPNSTEETQHFIDVAIEMQRQNPRRTFEFAVTLKDTGRLIGAAGLRINPGGSDTADIGYCYNKTYWRQGFSSEACARLIRMGFIDLGLHRIWATCDADNVGSAGVLRKCGMRQEGHFIKDKNIKGRWRDTLFFAILREEWEEKFA
jgi:[ribosomal protein S5]-alanine N-acetyltransferase